MISIVEQAKIIKREGSSITYAPTKDFKYAYSSYLYVKLPELTILPEYQASISCRWLPYWRMIQSCTCIVSVTEYMDSNSLELYDVLGPKYKDFYQSDWRNHLVPTTLCIPQNWSYCKNVINHTTLGPNAGIHTFNFDLNPSTLLSMRQKQGTQWVSIPFDAKYFKTLNAISDPELMIHYAIPKSD